MPDVPAVPDAAGLSAAVDAIFARDGALPRAVEGYEPRQGQRHMAAGVAAAVEEGGTLLAEAGTGTGKTLAYLIPAVLSRQRTLVSTGTKNLQEQIFSKDLPALRNALGLPFTATLMKGRSNYLCLHRWEIYRDRPSAGPSPRPDDAERQVLLPVIQSWLGETRTGDRAELRDLPEDLPAWRDVAATAETCLGTECPRYSDCFVTQMRQRAAESDIVIVNHHLLCADASVRQSAYGEVIPACHTLVVDEAHQLEDVATQYFGVAAGSARVEDLLRDTTRLTAGQPELARATSRLTEWSRQFFGGISMARMSGAIADARVRYTSESLADHFENGLALIGALEGLEEALGAAGGARAGNATTPASDQPTAGRPAPAGGVPQGAADGFSALQRRAGELRQDLRFLIRAADPDFVYFLEVRDRSILLRAAPIDVSRIVQQALFDRMETTVLTSATLSVDGSFDYVKGRLGIREAREVRVASEFDYGRQALLYLPRRMPPPRAPSFPDAAAAEVVQLLTRSRGRAFVLFTSYAVLRSVLPLVEQVLPYPILVQGTAPRSRLLEQFRATPNAVLFATSSFWQGVDVAGEALSCVIIDKLPFASPSDPVTSARIEAIAAAGGDAFSDYQVPLAILALQQGLGRLLRHRTDRGVLAVLDPRLKTMGYGRRFLASLPPAPVTHDIDAVAKFFGYTTDQTTASRSGAP